MASILKHFLHLTAFRNPFLRTLVPSVSAAFALQAAFGIPSIFAQTERFYDFSGAITNISVVALSLYLPALRARFTGVGAGAASGVKAGAPEGLPSLLAPFLAEGRMGGAALNWRQVVLSAAVVIWATRLGTFLFQRVIKEGHDSRFDEIKKSPPKFFVAWMAQATWCSLICMPVIALNSVPASAFKALPLVGLLDVVGVALWIGGFAFEATADRQKTKWVAQKKAKEHDEQFLTRGLWSRSRFPNYFGESTLWTGLATTAAGVLISPPVQTAIGLSGGVPGVLGALAMAYVSPAFTTFLVLKVSGVPLSEGKYDKKYGDRKDYQEWKANTPKFFPKIFA